MFAELDLMIVKVMKLVFDVFWSFFIFLELSGCRFVVLKTSQSYAHAHSEPLLALSCRMFMFLFFQMGYLSQVFVRSWSLGARCCLHISRGWNMFLPVVLVLRVNVLCLNMLEDSRSVVGVTAFS